MKSTAVILIIFLLSLTTNSQTITGKVTDKNNNPLTGANVYIEGSYDGASTGVNGDFSFASDLKGMRTLVVSFVGFREHRQEIDLSTGNVEFTIVLKESSNTLNAVTITAGSFEASDRKKGVVLKPLDIMTTAGGLGDIYGALQTLPGTSIVGEDGKLFVRGGAAYETKTFFDGMAIEQPYYSQMPDLPTRGRFSPMLFSGTVFSSGGYSAEYGQALSSALILESEGLADEDVTSIFLMTLGLGASHTERWKNTSLSASANYTHLGPYYGLIKQDYEWEIAPNGVEANTVFRQKIGKKGLLKTYASFGYGSSLLHYPDVNNTGHVQSIKLKEYNGYFNTTYKGLISEKWAQFAGVSYSNDISDYSFNNDDLDETIQNMQAKYTVTYLDHDLYKIKFGGDFTHRDYKQEFFLAIANKNHISTFTNNISSFFAETEFTFGPKIALRAGGRFEYASLLHRPNVAPRMSLAFKTGEKSQISLAYGNFYQIPEDEFIRFAPALNYEKATHYILNYQIIKNKNIFRIEGYYKFYNSLVKFDSLFSPVPESYNNNGEGYARGIDIFWRNSKINYLDYWISYGYVDTQRDYLDYPEAATPVFIANHNFRVVTKYFIPKINSQIGVTYSFASGRPYYNPENPDFHGDRTKSYNDLSLNISYLTHLWDNFTVIYFSIGNLTGTDNIFGYRYSDIPDQHGQYESMAIKPPAKRFIFLGVFISLTDNLTN